MNKSVRFNDIGYVAATFPVAQETQNYLKQHHLNASTGNVDINGKNLAVTLGEDGKVKFGTGTEALLGIIITYEMDGFAAVQIYGGIDEVPTAAALTTGVKGLAVDKDGNIVEAEGVKERIVALPSTADNKYASIIL